MTNDLQGRVALITDATTGYDAHAAAKAGVEALSRVATVEGTGKGIRVNTVAPGVINAAVPKSNSEVVIHSTILTSIDGA